MNKKVLAVFLVLVLAVSGLFAKDLGIKVGGQLGWGFERTTAKGTPTPGSKYESYGWLKLGIKNNGFAFNATGEYDFDQNWGVKANFGLMFAGKASFAEYSKKSSAGWGEEDDNSGLYIDFAVDAKYTYAINDKISVAGLAGLELVSGYLAKENNSLDDDLKYKNLAFGLNCAVEGEYKITDKISINGGVNVAWLFVNSAKFLKDTAEGLEKDGCKPSVYSFYIRPYIGATYAL